MVPNPTSRARPQYFVNLPLTSIKVKQSVMKQVIAKYPTENVGGGAGVLATSRFYSVITNFKIRVHLCSMLFKEGIICVPSNVSIFARAFG